MLEIPKAKSFARLAAQYDFSKLIECRKYSDNKNTEVVVVEVDVERPQRIRHPIRHKEILAIEFSRDDDRFPEVLALRKDFPLVPHLNLKPNEFPRSLCLYSEPFDEINLFWTPRLFLERIRNWLAKTSEGSLHERDQPLEPLLLETVGDVVVPPDLVSENLSDGYEFRDIATFRFNGRITLFLSPPPEQRRGKAIVIRLDGEAQPHGVIRHSPRNLYELHEFLRIADLDLLDVLRRALRAWAGDTTLKEVRDAILVIILMLPKSRVAGASVEVRDRWACMSASSIGEIGVSVGAYGEHGGHIVPLIDPDYEKNGSTVPIGVLHLHEELSHSVAAGLNGTMPRTEKMSLIGLGALGSQVFANFVRSGFGKWYLIDRDHMLPHNPARHAMPVQIGENKAKVMAYFGEAVIPNQGTTEAIDADILRPGALREEIVGALRGSTVVVDCSASVAVARHIARDLENGPRGISIFLNPTGADLIVLAEPNDRSVRLDHLEMQYYRLILKTPELGGHFRHPEGQFRYSLGCRDISSVVSQDLICINAGIASRVARQLLERENGAIIVFSVNPKELVVCRHDGRVYETVEVAIGGWIVSIDSGLANKILGLRATRLPNETGGVLLGQFDTNRKLVYVVDTVLAPPDSIERPYMFVRGAEGLRQEIDRVYDGTGGALQYIGEWHSHPSNTRCESSEDDRSLLAALSRHMTQDGHPAVMLTACDKELIQFSVQDGHADAIGSKVISFSV